MAKPKLYKLLNTFSKEDWLSAKKYIVAQNRSDSELPILYINLWENQSTLKSSNSIETIWNSFHSQHSRKSFMNLMSRLYNELIDWIGIDSFQKAKWEHQTCLLKD